MDVWRADQCAGEVEYLMNIRCIQWWDANIARCREEGEVSGLDASERDVVNDVVTCGESTSTVLLAIVSFAELVLLIIMLLLKQRVQSVERVNTLRMMIEMMDTARDQLRINNG